MQSSQALGSTWWWRSARSVEFCPIKWGLNWPVNTQGVQPEIVGIGSSSPGPSWSDEALVRGTEELSHGLRKFRECTQTTKRGWGWPNLNAGFSLGMEAVDLN
jgi:hypothetical protein